MLFLRYKTELTPDRIRARFEHLRDYRRRSPWNPFQSFEDPRVGFHVTNECSKAEREMSGYYEDGRRSSRTHRLHGDKIWFSLEIKPCQEGSQVTGHIHSAPYFTFLLWVILAVLAWEILTKGTASSALSLVFALLIGFFEWRKQWKIRESLLRLIPPIPKQAQ